MFNNKNYYPTPLGLIDKMLSKVDLNSVNNILEPSIGKGDILDRIKERTEHRRYAKPKLYGIEIDTNLAAICKSKGYKILHDDFLTYNTYMKFGLIIMNPPFDNGDRHLLKAIELQEANGGDVVCLLNAETIHNPYSNTRKDLLNQLIKYDADIEFIENAFSNAERKTNVDIALVSLKIPTERKNSVIIDHLKQEEVYKTQAQNPDYIVTNDYIDRIVQQYEFEVKAGVNLINEYESLKPMLSQSFDDKGSILELKVYDEDYNRNNDSLVNNFLKKVRHKYWSTLFQSKQFSQLFTSDLRRQYHEKIDELQEYDFSKYNIGQIKLDIQLMLKDSLEQTIYKLFDDFISYSFWGGYEGNIHYYNGWKTNEAHKLNEKKCIIPLNAFDRFNGGFHPVNYTFRDKLRDIHKVFTYLDKGKTNLEDDLDSILKEAQDNGQTKDIDCGYFKITVYKKGTTHFTWSRKDLIKKLNILGCQNRGELPPSYAKKSYSEMTKEEQQVIDSFEGEREYEETMQDREFYLSSVDGLLMLEGGE